MGVKLWGKSPLYMKPIPLFDDGSESTSRRQGRHREVGWCGEVWGGEKPSLTRLGEIGELVYQILNRLLISWTWHYVHIK